MYEEGRRLYTGEIDAAVRGAKAGGSDRDRGHGLSRCGRGLDLQLADPGRADPNCEYVVQDEWTEYTEFLEEGCDAALFVGMHARAGTRTAS